MQARLSRRCLPTRLVFIELFGHCIAMWYAIIWFVKLTETGTSWSVARQWPASNRTIVPTIVTEVCFKHR